jgi:hypothetical protein
MPDGLWSADCVVGDEACTAAAGIILMIDTIYIRLQLYKVGPSHPPACAQGALKAGPPCG